MLVTLRLVIRRYFCGRFAVYEYGRLTPVKISSLMPAALKGVITHVLTWFQLEMHGSFPLTAQKSLRAFQRRCTPMYKKARYKWDIWAI